MSDSAKKYALGITEDWFSLGILNDEEYRDLVAEHATGEDSNLEHYRWRTFSRFLSKQDSLAPEVARKLYALGESDADVSMGSAMMTAVLKHPGCPDDLLNEALESDRRAIRKVGHSLSK